jgi:acyl-coenzyme A thioesterase PaaI-like protein
LNEHHDGCFGCGQANPFGLQLEGGRFFVKQDHQGPPGYAHGGVLAAALDEAMSLANHAEGIYALTGTLEVRFHRPAPVGAFVNVRAGVERREGSRLHVRAEARADGGDQALLAEADGTFVRAST